MMVPVRLPLLLLSAFCIRGAPTSSKRVKFTYSVTAVDFDCHPYLLGQSQSVLDPYTAKPRVLFKQDGTFKLTVFSDLHFGEAPATFGPEQDCNSSRLLRTVLCDERPDFA